MGQSGTALKTLLVAAGVIGLVWLLSGFVFAPDLRDTHPLAIAVWLVFGGGIAIAILATNGLVPERSTASPFRNRTANDS